MREGLEKLIIKFERNLTILTKDTQNTNPAGSIDVMVLLWYTTLNMLIKSLSHTSGNS